MKKRIDPIPEEFESIEAAAEFWDTHDTADYWDLMQPVEVEIIDKKSYYIIPVETDLVPLLRAQARRKRMSVERLASALLRQALQSAQEPR